MNIDLEQLLHADLLEVPGDFEQRIVQLLPGQPAPVWKAGRASSGVARSSLGRVLQWLAVGGGLALGATQLSAFMFGLWTAVAAG